MSIAAIVGGSLASATVGAVTSSEAAGAQETAAQKALALEQQNQNEASQFGTNEWSGQQANEEPFLQAGQGAVSQLSQLLAPGGALTQPWTQQFQAPTAAQAAATPGYQWQLQQGQQAIQRSAAASGGLLSGGTAKALNNYAQGAASTDYQQVYNNQFQNYLQSYNQFQNNQTNLYNRLSGLAGFGSTAASNLGQEGAAAANNLSSIYLGGAQQQAQQLSNYGAAQASGYVGAGNAISGGLNSIGQTVALSQLLGGGNGQLPNNYNPNQIDTSQIDFGVGGN